MKSKFIIGIFAVLIIGLLVIAGCAIEYNEGNVQTLKQYYEHKEGEEGSLKFPLDYAARAKILSINLCKDSKVPEGLSNDCYIFGGDTITLQDPEDENIIQEYSITYGQAPYYLAEVLQAGDECQVNFDAYAYGNIESVRYCNKVSDEQIEQAKNDWEEELNKIIPTLYPGPNQYALGQGETIEVYGKKIKFTDTEFGTGDKLGKQEIVLNVDDKIDYTIWEGSEVVMRDCILVKVKEVTPSTAKFMIATLTIEKANLCNDVIINHPWSNCPEGVVC